MFLLLAPVSFDASTLELWGALLHGARLALAPPGPLSLDALGRAVSRHRVTTLWLTAGLFHQVVEEAPSALTGVRSCWRGATSCRRLSVRRVLEAVPGCTLVNGYGPTENTTFTTTHGLRRAAEVGSPVPIGRPVAHGEVYVLDAAQRPVPVGVEGELYAGGDGLSRGYHRRPGRTAERFVPDPFGDGGRLYRTGDRVRWLADGRLGFVGRAGGYVKLRGFRVEPGEVEVVLAEHPAVGAAAVAARGEGGEDLRLVAWVVPAAGVPAPGAEALGRFLGERLPAYMVPAAYVAVDALPLTANGKVDRAALPDPAPAAPAAGSLPPTSETGRELAELWTELLDVERVGTEDDFFALGGHSLLATRLLARVREHFGARIGLADFFASPTVAGLEGEILARQMEALDDEALALLLDEVESVPQSDVGGRGGA